jgi:hypothetical protein
MDEMLPNTTVSTDATLFREEAERARRYAAAMTDKKIIDRLIGIGGHLAVPPLPHHRAYGSRTRRFD